MNGIGLLIGILNQKMESLKQSITRKVDLGLKIIDTVRITNYGRMNYIT